MMDDDVVELGKVDGGEDASGRAAREGEMEDPDGGESESRKELGDSKHSGSGILGEIVKVSIVVEEGSGELENNYGREARCGQGGAVGAEGDHCGEFRA
jgi:hypothetical protein